MRRPFGKDYVRVRFPASNRTYTYYCPGMKIGESVGVPPNRFSAYPQIATVVALGRRWPWRVETATRWNWAVLGFQSLAHAGPAMRWAVNREQFLRREAMRNAGIAGHPLALFGWDRPR